MCSLQKDITEEEVKQELNKMEINKSRGNAGLTKEFYEAFWDHIKVPLLLSFKVAFLEKYSSKTSCNKTYRKKGPQQKVYKKLETYFFT